MSVPVPSRVRRALLRAAASLIAFGAAAEASARPAAPAPGAARTILVLGDSLSAEYGLRRGTGWVALLDRRLAAGHRGWRVVNASVSGETTAGGLARVNELLAREHPSLVVVELGGNDALRGLDLSSTEANLREIVRRARAAGARCLLIGMRMPPNYGRTYSEEFERVFRRVARDGNVPLVPFLLEGIADRIDLFQADRIHPVEAAQPRLLENVWPALKALLR